MPLPFLLPLALSGAGSLLRRLSNKQMPVIDPKDYGQSDAGYYGQEAYNMAREKFGNVGASVADRNAASVLDRRSDQIVGTALTGAAATNQANQLQSRELLRRFRSPSESPAAATGLATQLQSGLAAQNLTAQQAATGTVLQSMKDSGTLAAESANILREGRRQSLAEATPYAVHTDAAGLNARMATEQYNAENDSSPLRGLAEGVGTGLQVLAGKGLQGGPVGMDSTSYTDYNIGNTSPLGTGIAGAIGAVAGGVNASGANAFGGNRVADTSSGSGDFVSTIARNAAQAVGGLIGRGNNSVSNSALLQTNNNGFQIPNTINPQPIQPMMLQEPSRQSVAGGNAVTINGVNYRKQQIQQGDTLWDIAQKTFGDPRQWRKILTAQGQPFGYGSERNVYRIPTGTEILIPM